MLRDEKLGERESGGTPSAVSQFNDSDALSSEKMIRFFARAGGLIGASLDESENHRNLEKLIIPQITDELHIWLLDENNQLRTSHLDGKKPLRHWLEWKDSQLPTQVVRTGLSAREESYCCLPLRVRHQVIGAIECRNRHGRIFDTDDMIILDEVANRTAIAFENARLYQTLKTTEVELREAKQLAESASQTKSQFLANMSHEIRTPLGAILGFVDLMLSPGENRDDFNLWGQKIKRNGTHLLRLIDEILDLSKIESGHLEISKNQITLADFLQDIHLSLLNQAVHKGIRLEFQLETPIPSIIQTDPMRLKQILFNLIGNAIKFTDQGAVRVGIRFITHRNLIAFRITDTGVGLTKEQGQKLFRPFSQGDASHTRRFGGTGLGLVLSRDLARMLGGDTHLLQSQPGAGSTFEVTVCTGPLSDAPFLRELRTSASHLPQVRAVLPTQQLTGLKILLVEDSPDNQFLISRFLRSAGARVEVAEDGARGLEKAMRGDEDLILMDIQMPLLNGHQVTEILRRNGDRRPILALTAHALKEELEKSLAAGCDDHLTKPIDKERLIALVARHAQEAKKRPTTQQSPVGQRVDLSGFHGS